METKLATIEVVESISSIPGKDKIVLATMENLGWQVIVNKDEIKVGDSVVYCKIDSVLPEKEEFEFIRSRCFVDNGIVRGMRIKTIKFGGVVSQGIIFPISILPASTIYTQGQDVTKEMNVVHYLSKEDIEEDNRPKQNCGWYYKIKRLLQLKVSRSWPDFIVKTDEPRIQNVKHLLNDSGLWFVSEDVEGQSSSFSKHNSKYYVCSRTQVKKVVGGDILERFITWADNTILGTKFDGNDNWCKVSDKYHLENMPDGYVIQGEIIGPGIQGNIYNLKDFQLKVFNVKDIKNSKDLELDEMEDFCWKLGLETVPILAKEIHVNTITVEKMLEIADGKSVLYDTLREGIVFRKYDTGGQKVSFKVVSNKYLLEHKK